MVDTHAGNSALSGPSCSTPPASPFASAAPADTAAHSGRPHRDGGPWSAQPLGPAEKGTAGCPAYAAPALKAA